MLSSASMGPAYSLASTMGCMVAVAGAATPMALAVLTLCMLCIAGAYAALSQKYPDAGSSYAWIRRAFGERMGAFGAWLLLLANFFAVFATTIPAGTYTLDLLQTTIAPHLVSTPMNVACVGMIWVLVSTLLLVAGLRPTTWITAALLLAELLVLGVSALVALVSHPTPLQHVVAPPIGFSWIGIMSAMTLGIWVVDGWELSAATSEEARTTTGAGHGGVYALLLVSLVVLCTMLAYLHAISPAEFLAHQSDAMALVGMRLGGGWIPTLVVTVLVSTAASLWTTMLYLTRSLYAMGRDGVLPRWFADLDAQESPRHALLFLAVVLLLFTLVSGLSLSVSDALMLALSGSGVFLGLLFAATAAAAIVLVRGDRPWLLGVAMPVVGMVTIGAVCLGQVINGDPHLRFFVVSAVFIGCVLTLTQRRQKTALNVTRYSGRRRPRA